jgi:hypothetical protein
MFRRAVCSVLLIWAGLACVPAGIASASRRAPEVTPISGGQPLAQSGRPSEAISSCYLGEQSQIFSVNYIQPPDDAYYALLRFDFTKCVACFHAIGGYVSKAHVSLNGQSQFECDVPVSLAIYGVTGDSACRAPDLHNVIVPPTPYTLHAGFTGVGSLTFTLPYSVRLVTDAFLCVKFESFAPACSSWATRPQLVTTGACKNCAGYNVYPAGNDELCSVAFPGNLTMSVDLDSCVFATTDVRALGRSPAPAILSVGPNPGLGRELPVSFSLAEAGPARVELFDLLGHRIAAREVYASGPGMQTLDLAHGVSLRPGFYVVRLQQGGRTAARSAIVLR